MAASLTSIKGPMQEKLANALINLIDSFLNDNESYQFSKTAHFANNGICKNSKEERKVQKLLSYVFNADPASVAKAFPHAKPEWLLTRKSFNEGYLKENIEFVSVRSWKSVSPIQAAALCLDNFLLKKLLTYIVKDEKLRSEAKKQLEEVWSRVTETKERKENNDTKRHQRTMGQSEVFLKKEVIEKEQAYADNEAYGAPLKALIEIYSKYSKEHHATYGVDAWKELEKLWDRVGTCQKVLCRYLLQELFKEEAWSEDLNFENEPKRGILRTRDRNLFDFDIGSGSFMVLCKMEVQPLRRGEVTRWSVARIPPARGGMSPLRFDDIVAFERLYEQRQKDLGNIIDKLQTLETALELVSTRKVIKR